MHSMFCPVGVAIVPIFGHAPGRRDLDKYDPLGVNTRNGVWDEKSTTRHRCYLFDVY